MTDLISDEERAALLSNGEQMMEDQGYDPYPVLKLFAPDGPAKWLLTSLDTVDLDLAFGLCDLGHGVPELGFVRLSELDQHRGLLGLSIERDRNFRSVMPISAYARLAEAEGRIAD